MSLKCLCENHERYDITFFYKDYQQWKLACLQCQYESNLPKEQFIPIKQIEQVNLESQLLLYSEDIQEKFQETKTMIKQWIAKFNTVIEEIHKFIFKLDKQMMDRIETIQTFNLNNLTFQSFEAMIYSREIIKDEVYKKKDFLQTTESNLKQAYNLLQNLIKEEGPKLNSFNKENLVYKNQGNQIQQKSFIKIVEQIVPQQKEKSFTQQDQVFNDLRQSYFDTPNDSSTNDDEEKYIGEYKMGEYHGYGELKKDGYIYKGSFLNGLKHGKGQLRKERENYVFEGEFINGKKHGQGKETLISYDFQVQQNFKISTPKEKCTIILSGEFQYDKKQGMFIQETILNEISTRKYVYYENDECIEEFEELH